MCEFSGVNFPLQENITKPKSRQVSTWPKAFISMLWKKIWFIKIEKNALLCGVLRNEHDSMNSFCCFQNKLLHPDLHMYIYIYIWKLPENSIAIFCFFIWILISKQIVPTSIFYVLSRSPKKIFLCFFNVFFFPFFQ